MVHSEKATTTDTERVKIGFVSLRFGPPSQVWMWRQLTGFKKVMPLLLTWEYTNRDAFPIGRLPITLLHNDPRPYNAKGMSRWIYRMRCIPYRNYYASIGTERDQIEHWITSQKPKVLLAQFGFTALKIMPAAVKYRIPLVAHFHGLDVSSSLRNRWYRVSLINNLKHFACVVVVGSHQKEWMLRQGVPADRIKLIPCGVPTDEFAAKADYGRETDKLTFITVSRLVENKGLDYTVKAFAQVHQQKPGSRLTIVGEGPEKATLDRLVNELNLDDAVTFAGTLDPSKVHEALVQSDVFLQHSVVSSKGDSEGFGVSVAEAGSCGLPVVCSDSTGIRDQVVSGTTGYLVPQRDITAMKEKMLMLADNPDLRVKMGQAGRQHMIQHFNQTKKTKELEDVILSIAHKN